MKQNKSNNEPGTVLENTVSRTPIVSNHVGPNGESVDRLYGGFNNKLRLVNADYTEYKGIITKVSIMVKSRVDNSRFRSYCYKTEDGRWFDRAGLPIDKPKQTVANDQEDTIRENDTVQFEDTHQD
jgi:hypothetical protein